ncbi:MAG: DUF2490 domain-containing protein [Cryomorphaceae bacterium]|nr:MAG: DUF2490 domain-containing protein [Cryomorphaceae bacterium]
MMNRRFWCVAASLLFATQSFTQEERTIGREDFAIWAYYEFDYRLKKNTWLHYKNQYRLNENVSRFDYSFFDVGLNQNIAPWLRVTGAYVFNIKNHWRDGVLYRHQLYANAKVHHRFGNFRIRSRNQIQTGVEDIFGPGENTRGAFFYRQKLSLRWYFAKNWRVTGSGEAYFRLGARPTWESQVYRQRYILGLQHKLSPKERLEVYYLYQSQIRQRRPDFIYVLGMGYTRSIR